MKKSTMQIGRGIKITTEKPDPKGRVHKDHPEHYGIIKDGDARDQSPAIKKSNVLISKKHSQSEIFARQFKDAEFDLYCPLCGRWLHAFHLGGDNTEETCCLNCKIAVSISATEEGREKLTLSIDDGSDWIFDGTAGYKPF